MADHVFVVRRGLTQFHLRCLAAADGRGRCTWMTLAPDARWSARVGMARQHVSALERPGQPAGSRLPLSRRCRRRAAGGRTRVPRRNGEAPSRPDSDLPASWFRSPARGPRRLSDQYPLAQMTSSAGTGTADQAADAQVVDDGLGSAARAVEKLRAIRREVVQVPPPKNEAEVAEHRGAARHELRRTLEVRDSLGKEASRLPLARQRRRERRVRTSSRGLPRPHPAGRGEASVRRVRAAPDRAGGNDVGGLT